jgi:hypothetical protein
VVCGELSAYHVIKEGNTMKEKIGLLGLVLLLFWGIFSLGSCAVNIMDNNLDVDDTECHEEIADYDWDGETDANDYRISQSACE